MHVAQLEKAIEAARRIEHSLIASETSTPSQQDSSSTSTVSHEIPQRTTLVSNFAMTIDLLRTKDVAGSAVTHNTVRDCPRRPPKKNKKPPEICRNFNRLVSASCEQVNNKCSAGRLHKYFECHKWGCKALRHKNSPQSQIAGSLPRMNPLMLNCHSPISNKPYWAYQL